MISGWGSRSLDLRRSFCIFVKVEEATSLDMCLCSYAGSETNWKAMKEFKLNCYNEQTLSSTVYPYCDNLDSFTATQKTMIRSMGRLPQPPCRGAARLWL